MTVIYIYMNEKEDNLISEYEKALYIPAEKPHPQFLLCPVGLIGSGKTTVIKPLSEKLSLVRISSYELRKLFKENGLGYDHIYEAAAKITEKYIRLGYSIAIDGDCASEHSRELISKAERDLGIRAVWVHINPPESFIIDKLKRFKHTWLFTDADQAIRNYQERKPLHKDLDMPFVYTFDPSRDDLDRQLEEAVKVISDYFRS